MADTATAIPTGAPVPAKAPKKAPVPKSLKVKAPKVKSHSTHPKISIMVDDAIKNLGERGGSSLRAIKKYILTKHKVDVEKLAPFIRRYLKSGVKTGTLVQAKGKGANGSFKLPQKGTTVVKPAAITPKPKAVVVVRKKSVTPKMKITGPAATALAKKASPTIKKATVVKAKKTPTPNPKKATKVTKSPIKGKGPKPKKAIGKKAAMPKKMSPKKK